LRAIVGPDTDHFQYEVVWLQRKAGEPWQGKVTLLQEGRSVAETTLVEPADVQFPQAQQGPDGRHWVVYEKTNRKGSEIVLRNLTKELQSTLLPKPSAM
jgi:hypothetical protein